EDCQDLTQVVEVVIRPLGDVCLDGDLAVARVVHHMLALIGRQLVQPLQVRGPRIGPFVGHLTHVSWWPGRWRRIVIADVVFLGSRRTRGPMATVSACSKCASTS